MNNEELLKIIKDPKEYLERFTKIKSKEQGIIPFKLNPAQLDLFNAIRKHSRIITLKARQLGISTAVAGYIYHSTITTPGITSVLIGYNADLAAEFLDKIKTFYKTTPESLRPQIHYNSRNEISFPALDSKILVLPSSENVGRGYTIFNCVDQHTIIFSPDGMPRKIRDVKIGDDVINGNGGISKVMQVSSRKPTNTVLKLKIWQGDDLIATEDHKVLCRGSILDSFKPVWKSVGDVIPGDYIAFPYRQCRNRIKSINLLPVGDSNTIRLGVSKKLGEICGWYLAEGTCRKTDVTFSIHRDEVDYIVSLVKEVFDGHYNSLRINYAKNSKTAQVTINGKHIAEFFKTHFPGRSWEKTIPNYLWYWGWDFNKGLLFGLFSGDGCFKDIRRVTLTTVSPRLAYQVRLMLVSLRIGLASVHISKTKRYEVPTRDKYDVILSGKNNWKFRRLFGLPNHEVTNFRDRYRQWLSNNISIGWSYSRRGRTHYWMKVRRKENATSDFVYDITLKGKPHSFLTNSGVVHNCLVSELAFFDKAEEKMLAIENAVPKNGKIIVESTPNGIGNLYHRMWMAEDNGYAKKEYGWWWLYTEEEIENIKKRINDPMRFAQEYGLEFLSTGRPVFNLDLIKQMVVKHTVKVGDTFKDKDGQSHTVVVEDDLRIYKQPNPNDQYVVGADVAEGVTGGDYSTAVIWNRATGEEVGMYRGHVAADRFGALLNKWGRKYNKALMVVEINNHGLTTVTALKNLLYPQMYFRQSKFDTVGTSWGDRIGWKTSKVTRPLMIDDLAEAMREGSILIHSKELYDEMFTFVYDDGGNMTTTSGFHDDLIFAAAIGFQGFKVLYSGTLDQIPYEDHLPTSTPY